MGSTAVNRAIIYSDPGSTKTHIEEHEIEKPGPGQVLLKMLFSGVCHTDYAVCTNGFASLGIMTPQGQIGGHEGIGEIIEQGPGVKNPPIGTKVGIKYAAEACLNCDRCLVGGETSCEQAKISGLYSPGTFQQYLLSSAQYVTPIPDGVDLPGAAPLMCGGVTVYTALKRANHKFGEWLLIQGAGGGLGHLGILYGKALGAKIIAVDAGSKEAFCKELGADAFIDFTKFASDADLTAEVHRIAPGGVKTVLACTSSNKSYGQAVGFLGFRGTLVCVGVPDGELVPIAGAIVGAMIGLELTIFALKTGNRQDAKECLEVAARGLVNTHYQIRKMDELTNVFDEMHAGKINGRVVLDLR